MFHAGQLIATQACSEPRFHLIPRNNSNAKSKRHDSPLPRPSKPKAESKLRGPQRITVPKANHPRKRSMERASPTVDL